MKFVMRVFMSAPFRLLRPRPVGFGCWLVNWVGGVKEVVSPGLMGTTYPDELIGGNPSMVSGMLVSTMFVWAVDRWNSDVAVGWCWRCIEGIDERLVDKRRGRIFGRGVECVRELCFFDPWA